MNTFWKAFEEHSVCKYPKVIKDILNLCAIDRATFIDINENSIAEIECIVNQNKSVLKKSCYESIYEKDEQFKFLFGHRLLLLTLPQKYKLFCEHQKKKKESRKIRLLNSKDETTAGSSDSIDPEQVRNLLITHLKKSANNTFTINENDVKKFKINGDEAYCVVKCPFCELTIPCTYIYPRWRTTNFLNHIRSPHTKEKETSDANSTSDKTSLDTSKSKFQPARSSVLQEVKNILR